MNRCYGHPLRSVAWRDGCVAASRTLLYWNAKHVVRVQRLPLQVNLDGRAAILVVVATRRMELGGPVLGVPAHQPERSC